MKIGIIGSAGRGTDGEKFTTDIYFKMVSKTHKILDTECPKVSERHLISGGAPYADHVAVVLFNSGYANELSLYLPAPFRRAYKTVPEQEGNCGQILNELHAAFSKKVLSENYSLEQLEEALQGGAEDYLYPSFFNRNRQIAAQATDLLIAFTWSDTDELPLKGGTSYTWGHSQAKTKIHVPLRNLTDAN